MNIYDIAGPGTEAQPLWILPTVIALVALVAGGIGVMTGHGKKSPIRTGLSCAALLIFMGGMFVTSSVQVGALDDSWAKRNANFERALKDTYGATSSASYSDIMRYSPTDVRLTRNGESTPVTFIVHDGKITPYALSEYSK